MVLAVESMAAMLVAVAMGAAVMAPVVRAAAAAAEQAGWAADQHSGSAHL